MGGKISGSTTVRGFFNLKMLVILGIVFIAGIIFTGVFNIALHATNTTEFCTDCHSMKHPLDEYKQSVHYKNASGVRAGCPDCHVPKEFGPKMWAKLMAYKDVLADIRGTHDSKEDYDKHRWEMANMVWDKMKATDSRECRSCHSFDQMDLSEQDRSARKRHGRAPDEGKTCIECHKGIAHEEPDEPDEEEEEDEEDKG